MGNTAETRKTLAELSSASAKRDVPPTALASLYAVLGEKDRAFDCLDRADREKDEWFLLLSIDPYADPLRSDPRFEGYVRRLRL